MIFPVIRMVGSIPAPRFGEGSMKSIIIGYAICANCGHESVKFNWHTQYKCPVCGGKDYRNRDWKKGEWFNAESKEGNGLGAEEGSGIPGTGIPVGSILPVDVSDHP